MRNSSDTEMGLRLFRRNPARVRRTDRHCRYHRVVATASIAAALLFVQVAPASAQSTPNGDRKRFTGVYVGASGGSQNIFGGGAFINEIDVLTQDRRMVAVFSAGLRGQLLDDRLFVGGEVQYGRTDGDLTYFDPPSQSHVSYANDSQTGFGITVGYAAGARRSVAVFAYAFAIDRTFDIAIVDPSFSYTQTDGQSFLQYGLGVEIPVYGALIVRATGGRSYMEFGDLVTNIEVEKMFEFNAGIVYQF